jgi:hypothetical protein
MPIAAACGPSQEAGADQGARETTVAAAPGAAEGPGVRAPVCWIQEGSQELTARESALDSASVALAAGDVKICYGRPGKKDREIMGGLVPWDVPWRFGANEATAVFMPAPGTIAGVAVDTGWVSLYAVPGQSDWSVAVNGEARRWGRNLSAEVRSGDIGSASITPEAIEAPVELLTFRLDRVSASAATLVFEWDRTRLRVPIAISAAGAPGADAGG